TARIDDAQPELPLRPPCARAAEVGREIALEALVGKRSAVAEQAEAHLATGDDRAAARGITLGAGERLPNRVLRVRGAQHGRGRDDRGHRGCHPKTSAVIVRNHASASTASAARVARGASWGLTPPAPGTSASCPFADGW